MAVIPQTNFGTANTDRYPSGSVFGQFPMEKHIAYPGYYFMWFDDFDNTFDLSCGSTAATDGLQQPYATYIDTGDTVRAITGEKTRGVVRLLTAATDNNSPVITMQANRATNVYITDVTAADKKKLW